jgi:hypothetical protein
MDIEIDLKNACPWVMCSLGEAWVTLGWCLGEDGAVMKRRAYGNKNVKYFLKKKKSASWWRTSTLLYMINPVNSLKNE